MLKDYYHYQADVVVVDEASQLALAYGTGLGTMGFSTLLFGDPAQLSSAIYPEGMEEDPLAVSLLERFGEVHDLAFLGETFRSNRQPADQMGRLHPRPNRHPPGLRLAEAQRGDDWH